MAVILNVFKQISRLVRSSYSRGALISNLLDHAGAIMLTVSIPHLLCLSKRQFILHHYMLSLILTTKGSMCACSVMS